MPGTLPERAYRIVEDDLSGLGTIQTYFGTYAHAEAAEDEAGMQAAKKLIDNRMAQIEDSLRRARYRYVLEFEPAQNRVAVYASAKNMSSPIYEHPYFR